MKVLFYLLFLFLGMYWIDPNQGSPLDAIEVYCDIADHMTCIYASPSTIEKKTWYSGASQHVWFGEEMEDGYPVSICINIFKK